MTLNTVISASPRLRRRGPTLRASWRPLAFLLLVAAYALLVPRWQVEPLPGDVHALGVLVFATSLVPLTVWTARTQRGLPMFEVIALSYALHYSLPLYTQPRGLVIFSQFVPVSWTALYETLWLVEAGLIAFMAGYYLFLRSSVSTRMPRLDLPLLENRRATYIRLSLIFGGAIMALSAAGVPLFQLPGLGAVLRLLAGQFYLAMILLGYQVYEQPQAPLGQRLRLYAAAALAFMVGLSTGSIENAFVTLVGLFLVRWHVRGRLPWHWLTAAIVLFIILNPAKFAFRDQVWFGGTDYSLGQRLVLWSDLAADSAESLAHPTFADDREQLVRDTLSRIDLIHKFAYVHTLTPQIIPYYRGTTYSYFLIAWIPRVFWPNKPTATGGANDRMDVDYRLKYEGQSVAVGIGLLPEAYANFGNLGVALIMALQGAVFGLLNAMLNSRASQGGRAIYLSVGVYFLNGIGTSASVMFGAIFQQVLASAILLRPFTSGWRATSDHATPKNEPPQTRIARSYQRQ